MKVALTCILHKLSKLKEIRGITLTGQSITEQRQEVKADNRKKEVTPSNYLSLMFLVLWTIYPADSCFPLIILLF